MSILIYKERLKRVREIEFKIQKMIILVASMFYYQAIDMSRKSMAILTFFFVMLFCITYKQISFPLD